ncbi:MAG: phosphoenolpyruvate synthase [Planctomycetes bacterium]|nr:phosphoenolpyruvate synthase [Planctomycetota bacterium]
MTTAPSPAPSSAAAAPAPFVTGPEAAAPAATAPAAIGGKGANLARLGRAGFRVPPWFAVTTAAYADFAAAAGLDARVRAAVSGKDLKNRSVLRAAAAAARAAVLDAPLPPAVAAAVSAAYATAFPERPFVAVRSSVVGEDAADASFAGQMDTFLFVPDDAAVLAALKNCWASAFSERALAYRAAKGLDPAAVSAAVVVQEMVEGDRSGVLFTANPTNGARDQVVLSAVLGLGEGLVSGLLAADSAVVARNGGKVISRDTVDKEKRVVFDRARGAGTREEEVPAPLRAAPALDDAACARLADLGTRIEAAYGGAPQDVEWTLRGADLFVLQARPITTLAAAPPGSPIAPPGSPSPAAAGEGRGGGMFAPPNAPAPPNASPPAPPPAATGRLRLWDNSNIIESYSGVTTPLTFTFAKNAYREVYRQFLRLLGVHDDVIDADDRTLRNMLALIRGRIFYNLNHWYKLVSYLPGFEFNREFMEGMMGVRESGTLLAAERAHAAPPTRALGARLRAWLRVFRVGGGLAWHFYRLDRSAADFLRHFEQVYARHYGTNLDTLDEDGLVDLYFELENQLLRRWRAPIVNDFSAMIFFGVLRKLCGSWCGDAGGGAGGGGGTLHNDLLCGEGGIESTEPMKRILALAQIVRADARLRAFVEATPPAAMHTALAARQTEFPALWSGIVDYLERYGDRCMMELKLESRNLRDDPGFLYKMLRNYLAEGMEAAKFSSREQEVRSVAERRVAEKLGGSRLRTWAFNLVLRRARASVKNRENMRFARTKVFGLARRIFRALGTRYAERGFLDAPEDIFYLELHEIFGVLDGTLTTDELAPLARTRRARFDGYRREPAPPDRLQTRGLVYGASLEAAVAQASGVASAAAAAEDPNLLRGLPACAGTVTSACRVISSPDDEMSLNGQILVCERTDPGWVPLFLSASGLLVERGSLLSHSAIVAREMGIPAIVSIPNLTKRIRDGQVVTMDAAKGVVYLDGEGGGRTGAGGGKS